jgi:hypothetical protein
MLGFLEMMERLGEDSIDSSDVLSLKSERIDTLW